MNIILPIIISLSLISGLLTFILNPGVIYSDNSDEKVYCSQCQFLYPKSNKNMEHCYICGICICKLDHHCDVIGKCVGKNNIVCFLLFVFSGFAFGIILSVILVKLLKLM